MKDFKIKVGIKVVYIIWIVGVDIAKGFISTTLAIITGGIWSLYLIVIKYLM